MYKHSCMYVYVEFLFIKAILVYLIYFLKITVAQFCFIYMYKCVAECPSNGISKKLEGSKYIGGGEQMSK